MLRPDLDKDAGKFLSKLPPKQQRQVAGQIDKLLSNPKPHDSIIIDSTPPPIYRNTIGEYRIVYVYDEAHLVVLKVGKRNDGQVYKADFKKLRTRRLNELYAC